MDIGEILPVRLYTVNVNGCNVRFTIADRKLRTINIPSKLYFYESSSISYADHVKSRSDFRNIVIEIQKRLLRQGIIDKVDKDRTFFNDDRI
jgi:hypothetical protein